MANANRYRLRTGLSKPPPYKPLIERAISKIEDLPVWGMSDALEKEELLETMREIAKDPELSFMWARTLGFRNPWID